MVCEPSYLTNAIELLGHTAQTQKWMTDTVWIVDVMALQKSTIWNPKTKHCVGPVNYWYSHLRIRRKSDTESLGMKSC